MLQGGNMSVAVPATMPQQQSSVVYCLTVSQQTTAECCCGIRAIHPVIVSLCTAAVVTRIAYSKKRSWPKGCHGRKNGAVQHECGVHCA